MPRRRPRASSDRKTQRRNSSTRSCFSNVWTRFELPVTAISPPACFLRRATAVAASPDSRVELCHSTLRSVREATYLGMLFSFDATGSFGSVTRGQCAAKISYVLRPSSSASDCSVCSTMSLPIMSSQYFTDQPPSLKPPSRSSSGPPGACITPSIVTKVPTTNFLMRPPPRRSALIGSLQRRDVEFLHLEHDFHHAPGLGSVRIGKEPVQHRRHDLPREAEAVLHPAALFGLRDGRQGFPVPIHLRLVLARDRERDGFVELEVRSPIQAAELLAHQCEVDGQDVPLLPARRVRRRRDDGVDPGARKQGRVELRGCLRLAIEPEARDDALLGGLRVAGRRFLPSRHVIAPSRFGGMGYPPRVLILAGGAAQSAA